MSANTTRELIKEKFLPFTKMPWIDFNKGDAEVKSNLIDFLKMHNSIKLYLGMGTIK